LDVGAGLGAITEPLVASGASVIAIEMHPRRAAHLRDLLGDRAIVVRADASDLRLPRRPFHVVACPPYGITSALLRRLLHDGSRMVSAHLVIQDAAACRWTSPHAPAAGRWQRVFSARLGPPVPPRAFDPPPQVRSRVLVVERRRV
jgi:23S rRNA (adenine-N6)-dimethyltransferase